MKLYQTRKSKLSIYTWTDRGKWLCYDIYGLINLEEEYARIRTSPVSGKSDAWLILIWNKYGINELSIPRGVGWIKTDVKSEKVVKLLRKDGFDI